MPGDAFAVLCPNPTHEVTQVINRLGLDGKQVFSLNPVSASSTPDYSSLLLSYHRAAASCERSRLALETVVRKGPLPQHIKFPCTVRTALTHYVDLHAVPKKSSLRTFAEHASDPKDRVRRRTPPPPPPLTRDHSDCADVACCRHELGAFAVSVEREGRQ